MPASQQPVTARDHALVRAKRLSRGHSDIELARCLNEYADEIERDTGRAYVPTYMREAARRLSKKER